jgi:ketosteroid isomerase-like protein
LQALEWLKMWEGFINATDYTNARRLFSPNVTGFGTIAGATMGIDQLEAMQWRKVWPTIRNFRFDNPVLNTASTVPKFSIIAATWRSEGQTGRGGWYERRGRATLILEDNSQGLLCVHSHFSMEPGVPALF